MLSNLSGESLMNFYRAAVPSLVFLVSGSAFAYDTKAAVIKALAVGDKENIEVSFEKMENPEKCSYSGAYVVASTVNVATKNQMLSLLIASKAQSLPVRVRLSGCTDRPTFIYVFSGDSWIP